MIDKIETGQGRVKKRSLNLETQRRTRERDLVRPSINLGIETP